MDYFITSTIMAFGVFGLMTAFAYFMHKDSVESYKNAELSGNKFDMDFYRTESKQTLLFLRLSLVLTIFCPLGGITLPAAGIALIVVLIYLIVKGTGKVFKTAFRKLNLDD